MLDSKLRLFGDHIVTFEMTDLLTYAGQVAMPFEKASELINKFMGSGVSENMIRLITEETGKKFSGRTWNMLSSLTRHRKKLHPMHLIHLDKVKNFLIYCIKLYDLLHRYEKCNGI